MALDMVIYKLLAIQDLTRENFRLGDKLPVVFQVVFYNGEEPWNVPTSLLDMLQPVQDGPKGLDFWSYKLIDAQRVNLEDLVGTDSPLLGLLRLEQLASLEDLEDAFHDLRTVLGPQDKSLAEAFLTFINEVVVSKLHLEGRPRWRLDDLEEKQAVVTQRIERIVQELRLEGREEGLREGELAVLRRLLERKFGELPEEAIEKLERADVDLLLSWSDRILSARKLADVFEG